MPLFSVIIPTWNRSASLVRAVESALSQTLADIEVLVCDDGSTDNSRDLVLALRDDRVRWIEGEHSGIPAAPRNRGLKNIRGAWIAFLDSDDVWYPEKLASQLDAVESAGVLASCTNAVRVDRNGVSLGPLLGHATAGLLEFEDLCTVNSVVCSSAIIHSSLLPIVSGFPEDRALKVGEDYSLWLRVASVTSFAYLNDAYVLYRDVPGESVRAHGLGEDYKRLKVLKNYLQWVVTRKQERVALSKNLELARRAERAVLLGMLRNKLRINLVKLIKTLVIK